ncbi:MAG: hypothetical protein LQ350_006600 [Teloschistes chrysophthalmus]|nr:MAG: hypothetical protein LQ350_006600 [Niorma chrysophthalma]
MSLSTVLFLASIAFGQAAYLDKKEVTRPTQTGAAPFLAATNPAPFGTTRSFVANAPLETALPIVGNAQNASIFQLMGQVSPYFPNPEYASCNDRKCPVIDEPSGFGVQEMPLPPGASIGQVHVLHRHGSRYPTSGAGVSKFGVALAAQIKAGTAGNFTGALSFLNSWSYKLGSEILVPVGRQELFDSGVLHYYDYGHLYNTSTKIIARTTTQDRMLKSAEYFMAGFFGLEWTNNATLELIIEQQNFNNSLAGYFQCNNSNAAVNAGGNNASMVWENVYLQNATKRLQALSPGFKLNVSDVYNMQTLCPYETVAFGYSAFCDLFTYEEWQDFEYSIDLSFAGNNYFQSPTGRAVGIGYVEEILARLQHHVLTTTGTQANLTLDGNERTFPLNQTLYFDFSHDTNMAAILTAFGLTQFAPVLPSSGPPAPNRSLIVSHLQPFGARVDIEIISAPQPVAANRTAASTNAYSQGPATSYIHFIINQVQNASLAQAQYDYSCNGYVLHSIISFPRVAPRRSGWWRGRDLRG